MLTGDYSSLDGPMGVERPPAGAALREPTPLFAKLDSEQVVAEELARMEAATAA